MHPNTSTCSSRADNRSLNWIRVKFIVTSFVSAITVNESLKKLRKARVRLCFSGEKIVKTPFAQAGDNKSWRKEKTGLEKVL